MDFDLVVNAETGIFPGKELFDHVASDLFLRDEHL